MLFYDFIVYLEEEFSIRSHPIISKQMPIQIGSYNIIKYANPGYGSPPGLWICGLDPETLTTTTTKYISLYLKITSKKF